MSTGDYILVIGLLGLVILFWAINNHNKGVRLRLQQEAEEKKAQWIQAIQEHIPDWGDEICQKLLNKTISLDMTQEMVRLSLGNPDTVDSQEITKTTQKERWLYGQPRKGAMYIWFTNGKVTKIKN
jgi:hypothetical protein